MQCTEIDKICFYGFMLSYIDVFFKYLFIYFYIFLFCNIFFVLCCFYMLFYHNGWKKRNEFSGLEAWIPAFLPLIPLCCLLWQSSYWKICYDEDPGVSCDDHKCDKVSNQRPISLWLPDYSIDALCISFSTL